MSEVGEWAPHETRIFALQVAVEFISGSKGVIRHTSDDVLVTARKFEEYLTGTPMGGHEPIVETSPE